jgi:hypothetical protein
MRYLTVSERFWKRVNKTKTCWIWLGYKNSRGYGRFTIKRNKQQLVHRYAYEEAFGEIPEGLTLDHLCNITSCVNPNHLKIATLRENCLRSEINPFAINARKVACMRGHPLSGSNLYIRKTGFRTCRTCQNEKQRKYRARNSSLAIK